MSTQIQRRRGTTAQHASFTGAAGELTVDTDKDTVVVHDGSTAGGFPMLKEAAIGSTVQAYNTTLAGVAAGTTALGGFRNKIIGGDFTVNPWQRGTSFTGWANGAYSADRWTNQYSMDGVVDLLKTADAPTAAEAGVYTQHCLHVDVTTADASIAAAQYFQVVHFVEGLNSASFGFGQAGTRYVTLSFWHKHTKTGTYCVAFLNAASNRSYVAEYVQDVSDTWEKATITIAVDTTGTWLYTNGKGLCVYWSLACGSNYHTTANTWQAGVYLATANQVNALDSTANNFKIALVQLEAGSVATPFETRSVGQELALCQRYYYRLTAAASNSRIGPGMASSTTLADIIIPFPVTMRTNPTVLEQSGTAGDYGLITTAINQACSAVPTFSVAGYSCADCRFTVASGMTAGHAASARFFTGTSGYLGFSAEL